jgi:hypothetical protein
VSIAVIFVSKASYIRIVLQCVLYYETSFLSDHRFGSEIVQKGGGSCCEFVGCSASKPRFDSAQRDVHLGHFVKHDGTILDS